MVVSKKFTVLVAAIILLAVGLFNMIGKTYAYNVVNGGAGLKITLDKKTGTDTKGNPIWTVLATETTANSIPLFDSDNWEPGAMRASVLRVTNTADSSVATSPTFEHVFFPYATQVDGSKAYLADVLNVYMWIGEDIPLKSNGRPDLSNSKWISLGKLNTLSNAISTPSGISRIELAPGASQIYTLLLTMDESAGNEYQNAAASIYAVINAVQVQNSSST